ncbi:MAG: FtsQ-type POTRA domain-containing protein [Desulfobacterota bacterium]|nr:FtsQ-type POTRA domain-containing protein [Thermodesulfobacteriota bacterium]
MVFTLFIKEEPILRLKGIKVSGCDQIKEEEIISLVLPKLGKSILNLDTQTIRKALMAHPYVAEVKVKRVYPFYLHIAIREKSPTALWAKPDGTVKIVDEEGRPFRDLMLREKSKLPLIHAENEENLKEGLILLKGWVAQNIVKSDFIAELVYSRKAVRVVTTDSVEILLGREDFEKRLKKALKVMEDAKRRGVLIKCIDARFEKGAIIRERGEG